MTCEDETDRGRSRKFAQIHVNIAKFSDAFRLHTRCSCKQGTYTISFQQGIYAARVITPQSIIIFFIWGNTISMFILYNYYMQLGPHNKDSTPPFIVLNQKNEIKRHLVVSTRNVFCFILCI